MSTAPIGRRAAAGWPPAVARLLRGWLPLHAWSARRRASVAGSIAALACALAIAACVAADFPGAAAAHAALTAAHRELVQAQRAPQALPALREAAALAAPYWPTGPEPRRNSADDARTLSELAASARIALVSLEPGAPGGQGADAFHVFKLTAQGEFARLRAFLHGLAHAPVLIVPTEVTIRRGGSQLSLAATLSVFDALPPLPGGAADRAPTAADPFATERSGGVQTAENLRLVGLLHDRTRAIALIETPHGTEAVERGGRIDGELDGERVVTVVNIAPAEVTLAAGGTTQVLTWTEEERR